VGIAAHLILQGWDFSRPPERLPDEIDRTLQRLLESSQQPLLSSITASLRELFASFGASDVYAQLREAELLGREVPFIMPWGHRQVMEGVIDLIYRLDGDLWVADYKTDAVTSAQANAHAERYRTQGEIYKAAVRQSLGTEPRFQCLFLRSGMAVEL
jgi:ATP-dependent helicase/nuclease subunit A